MSCVNICIGLFSCFALTTLGTGDLFVVLQHFKLSIHSLKLNFVWHLVWISMSARVHCMWVCERISMHVYEFGFTLLFLCFFCFCSVVVFLAFLFLLCVLFGNWVWVETESTHYTTSDDCVWVYLCCFCCLEVFCFCLWQLSYLWHFLSVYCRLVSTR